MKNIFISFSVLAIAFIFSGCTKNKGASTNASVMFVNGCSGTTGIYARVNSTDVGPGNIPFFNNSGYQNVTAAATERVNFYLVTQGTPLCSGTEAFTVGDHYSVFAGGIITISSLVVTEDDLTAPASGNAKVRFINLSSDNLNEKFSVGSQTLDSNVTSGQCTQFFQIGAISSAGITAVDPSHTASQYIAQLAGQSFNAGKIYTVMLTGTSAGSGASKLTLTVITNN